MRSDKSEDKCSSVYFCAKLEEREQNGNRGKYNSDP
jgi:hypothetical protein